MTKKRIIFIITFSTKPSEYENQDRPMFCWFNPQGEMIGIWDKEWGDIILKTLVSFYPQYRCEVWQPELRADKLYSAQLQENLTHRKYPAVLRKTFKRGKLLSELYSESIVKAVCDYDDGQTLFMLPVTVYNKWLQHIIMHIERSQILYYNMLNLDTLLPAKVSGRNPLKAFNMALASREKLKRLRDMRALITGFNNSSAMKRLLDYNPSLKIYELKWGVDFDFWKPVLTKTRAKEQLGIPNEVFMIVLSQRLTPEYQIDKFLKALSEVRTKRCFCCYITGHGSPEYEMSLKQMVTKYELANQVFFIGFVSDADLRAYLNAADLFATFATRSAGSGGALKAMALETPVLVTVTTGETYDLLKKEQAGVYVDPANYSQWVEEITSLIEGRPVKVFPRRLLEEKFSWEPAADSLYTAIEELL